MKDFQNNIDIQNKIIDTARKAGKGIIFINPNSEVPERDILRHELTHAIREHKNVPSFKYYKTLPGNIIEEAAATIKEYSRSTTYFQYRQKLCY